MELFSHYMKESDPVLAVTEEGRSLRKENLETAAERLAGTIGGHRLIFLLCENTPGTLLGYLSCLKEGIVPLLLDAQMDPALLEKLLETYHPAYLYVPERMTAGTRTLLRRYSPVLDVEDSTLLRTGDPGETDLSPELALLLTTSGSTGSPKLVRLSGRNLDANAASIAEYLNLTDRERPITNLAMNYSYGMSVVNSHFVVGAPLILTARSVLEREFWELMKRESVTSLTGVPYTYRMFQRVGMMEMDLPDLHTLTQAGGKLPEELHRLFAQWAERTGRKFIVMYGQTEAGPRMGYLPAEWAVGKCGSMGIPIPGGAFRLIRDDGTEIREAGTDGELVYQGENVAMGYAQCAEDLQLGDQWQGTLHTGDMARRDQDGFYYITGRKSRFVKLYGNRVSLDEVERILTVRFADTEFACTGTDDCLKVFHDGKNLDLSGEIQEVLSSQMRFPARVFHVQCLESIPKNSAGKTQYSDLEKVR